jgi:hypothetical protein
MFGSDRDRVSYQFRRLPIAALCCVVLLLSMVSPAHAAGITWHVNRPGDDPTNGDLPTHSGSLRFALTHAASGDLVLFGDVGVDTIFIGSTLFVPPGVAVGGARDQADCGSYSAPLANIEDSPLFTLRPVVSLGAGASLHGVNIGGGGIGVKITGDDVDICGVGIGLVHDGDGNVTPLPPQGVALIIDGARTTVRRNYLNGAVVVSSHSSDTRIGDAVGGSGDANDGVRDASVSILTDATDTGGLCANSTNAAHRVTIRDRFPRGLVCLEKPGVSGGDDVASHVNNWAQTPTVFGARTDDGATVQISGLANPLSVVDLFLDYQVDIERRTVMADALGNFSYSGPLPAGNVWVYAASTLDDPAHPTRIGSSSEWSGATAVISSTNQPLLSSLGSVIDLSRSETGPAHSGDILRFNITMVNIGSVDVTNINSTVFQASPTVTLLVHSHKMIGGIGFVATDSGFSNGTLAPGQTAVYSIDALVKPTDKATLASLSMEVNGVGIISTPVRALMPIVTEPSPAPLPPRVWLALAMGR